MPLTEDFTFQYTDTGLILNTSPVMPFVDVHNVSGLDSTPLRMSERAREGMDGGFLEAEYEEMRTIVIEGMLYATVSNAEPFLEQLKANFAPTRTNQPFYFKAAGIDERVIFCKSLGVKYNWETLRRTGKSAIQFQLKAEDPIIYGPQLSETTGLGTADAQLGRAYPRSYNFGYGGTGQTTGSQQITLSGNRNTYGTLVINGPITNPGVLHEESGKQLTFTAVLSPGEYYLIDLRNRTVKLMGVTNRRNALNNTSRWFMFQPGSNTIRFMGSQHVAGPPNASLQIVTRPASR